MYTLWVCSLLVIPPPIGRTVPQGGFLTDLTELNLLGWADLVQDVAVGLQVLPPRLCLDLGTQAVALLQLLEAATGVGFCHHCCHPRPCCTCMGASQPAPPTSWSQIVQQAQGYRVISSSRGVSDLSTPMGGMPGYVALLQASPLQISPFGAYLLRRSLHPQGYLYPSYIGLPWGGPPH